jgi:hypothetical protein
LSEALTANEEELFLSFEQVCRIRRLLADAFGWAHAVFDSGLTHVCLDRRSMKATGSRFWTILSVPFQGL